jgi:hypothetical protein
MSGISYGVVSSHLARRERHRNHCPVIIAPPKEATARGVVMTHRPPTKQRDSNPVPLQEDRLLDLLRKAEGCAYALAHGYDIGGHHWSLSGGFVLAIFILPALPMLRLGTIIQRDLQEPRGLH